ncbi:MAG: ABC transporter permease [Gemmatimonadota bacterium]
MIVRFALRELRRHRVRTALGVAGVAIAAAMLLDMLMLSRGLQISFRGLLEGAGYELRVAPSGTLPLETGATLTFADALIGDLTSEDGVRAVAPVLAANLAAGGSGLRVFALGVDARNQGVYRMRTGDPPTGAQDVIVSEAARDALAAAGQVIAVGDSLNLAPYAPFGRAAAGTAARFRITGIADFVYSSASERPIALGLDGLRELTGREDEASFLMLSAESGTPIETLARRLAERYPAVEVASVSDLVERAETRLSYFRQLAFILGSVSLVVTALLVGTIAAVSTNDRVGTIAAVRAIGISRRSILLALIGESVASASLAGAIGIGLGYAVAGYLDGILSDFPGLPAAVRFFVLEPRMVVVAAAAILGTAVVAAGFPAWLATRLPIATTLHREEP